jgi:hypothetical protein
MVLLLFSLMAGAQKNATISGTITDAGSGEALIGATVVDLQTGKGVVANHYGFYSITLPSDSVTLRFSFLGFEAVTRRYALKTNQTVNIELSANVEIAEVEIVAAQQESVVDRTQMSRIDVSLDKVKALPVLLGERDVLKTIQLMPGVQSGTEGASGLYVRGGGPDQNLILLDGVPIYNASHLFGFFSVFNTDALNSVELIKGGFPAEYGGRLSSVIDMRMKEGNNKKLKGEGGIGLIASRLTLEGPIGGDKTSFMVSGRRTYIDVLARPLIRAAADGGDGGYFFYDLNAKVNHRFSDRSRIYLSGYFGRDRFFVRDRYEFEFDDLRVEETFDAGLSWGNAIGALRWNYIFGPRLFSNTTVTYSNYNFEVGTRIARRPLLNSIALEDEQSISYLSGIRDWGAKTDFNFYPNPAHRVKFGAGYIYHTFIPGVTRITAQFDNQTPEDIRIGADPIYAHEFSAYVQDDWSVNERLRVNVGLHASGFLVNEQSYTSWQPRLSGRYLVNEQNAVKASFASMTQFLHLLTNAGIGLPTDLWVPPTDRIAPQMANQWALGWVRTLPGGFEVSVEGYYKIMHNLIEYRDGASFIAGADNWQNLVELGKGWSYGAELFIEKKVGNTTGWVGYTLSRTDRQFEALNFGEVFPYRYDRRHDVSVAVTHVFNDRADLGVVWVYGTGNAVTLPLERYQPFGGDGLSWWFASPIGHIESRNNYRMPAYHRLDIGLNLHKTTRWGERTWNLGVYNAYSRMNPFFLYFSADQAGRQRLTQFSLFPIIPSITYNFSF